mgnify:CR=1 FL=1|jgi:hypothetical protein
MTLKTNCKNFKSRNCPDHALKVVDTYKFEVAYDKKYFGNDTKMLHCNECDICFPNPMPSNETLDEFYKFVYRAKNRPHEPGDVYPTALLESRLKLLAEKADFSKIKNILEIGPGNGLFGELLKKKYNIDIYAIEPDTNSRKLLLKSGYKFYDEKTDQNIKFDLILSFHSLEHFTLVDSFFNLFENVLNENAVVCVEVPNNPVDKWFKPGERPYDAPHTLFFSKKSLEKIFTERNYKLIFSDYNGMSIKDDFKAMEEEKKRVQDWYPNKIYFKKEIKKVIKFFIPSLLLKIKNKITEDKTYEADYYRYGDENQWVLRILARK